VFDLDSVGLLSLLAEMNEGLSDARRPEERLDRTDFFLGCVVTNHKRHEREVMPQYLKLKKKVQAGARFVINQIGWNARKDDELLRFVRREQLPVGMLANVYILSRPAARAFHAGKIPGVVMSEELLELVERYAAGADNGREFFVDLAARHVAVARGLGFQGVYLGGHWPAATFGEVSTAPPRTRARPGRSSAGRSASASRASSISSSRTPRPALPPTASARPTSSRGRGGGPRSACP
jgi:methylenetetrahydrofolate reductase (NADPH)